VGCWRSYLSGARCRLAYGPADATATLSLSAVKSRLVLPFWYWLAGVVPDKGPLNGCVCLCVVVYKYFGVWNVRIVIAYTLARCMRFCHCLCAVYLLQWVLLHDDDAFYVGTGSGILATALS